MPTVAEIAQMIDHSILHPTFTDADLKEGCKIAMKYKVASVCVKPYMVRQADEYLEDSDVKVGAVIGFPHGNSSIDVKVYECKQAIEDGAEEIDMVINLGKALGEHWAYVEEEISRLVEVCRKNDVILKVIFENDFIEDDRVKIRLCEICSTMETDYVKTSSGYGFVKGTDGKYSYKGATVEDLKLMRKHSASHVKVKAAGGVRTLDDALAVIGAGADRIGATATVAILEEARKRFG